MQPTLFIAALFAGLVSFAAAAPQNGLTAMQAEVNAIVAKSLLSRNLMKRYDTTGSYECNSCGGAGCCNGGGPSNIPCAGTSSNVQICCDADGNCGS